MKNILLLFVIVFSLLFLINVSSARIPNMELPPGYSECTKSILQLNVSNSTESHQQFSICISPFNNKSAGCNSIPQYLPDRNNIIAKCYAFRDSIGWDSCENITDLDGRDVCYNSNLKCDKIVNSEINKACLDKVKDNRIKSITRSIKEIIILMLFVLSPLVMLFIIIKTVIDITKKNKIRWWLRITIFVISLFVFLFIIAWFFMQAIMVY